jgi:hypothetical protein
VTLAAAHGERAVLHGERTASTGCSLQIVPPKRNDRGEGAVAVARLQATDVAAARVGTASVVGAGLAHARDGYVGPSDDAACLERSGLVVARRPTEVLS